MNTDPTARTPVGGHGSFYIPWIDSPPAAYVIDPSSEQIDFYVPPSPIDLDELARSLDPRKIYHDEVRKITMESMTENGRIVGGPHRLPPKPILYADAEARERALRTDGTQYDGPSGTVSWYYRADMSIPRPIPPTSSVMRFQNSLSAGRAGEAIGIDPIETIGGDGLAWRRKQETQSKKEDKRFDPVQSNKKQASLKKRKAN